MAGAHTDPSDGHGGTLIDPSVALFAQTAAALAPSVSIIGQTPLLRAAASATAGHI
jgi:hypothetical protein